MLDSQERETLKAQSAQEEKGTRFDESVNYVKQARDCKASQEEYRLTLHGPEQFFWQGSEA